MADLRLCANCLEDDGKPFPVGHEKGSQRDPYYDKIQLCEACALAVTAGDFDLVHDRYRSERTVRR